MLIDEVVRKILALFLLTSTVRRCKNRSSLFKIRIAHLYVQGVKKSRVLLLALILGLLSLVLFGGGLFLIHSALLTYSAWDGQTRFVLALVLGTIETFGAVSILYLLFREKTWIKFCAVDQVVSSVTNQQGVDNETKTDEKERS